MDTTAVPATFEAISRHCTTLRVKEFWPGEHDEVGQLLQGCGEQDAEIDVACRLGRAQATCWLLDDCR